MNKTGLVSVVMAAYNGEKFIKQQLDSILLQSYTNFELIIVDDCSTDQTLSILRIYEKKYSDKIKVYTNDFTLGYLKNFEKALSLCWGEYIALSDQDDIWFPSKLSRLVDEIGAYSMIYSDVALVDGKNHILSASRTRDEKINNHSDILFGELIFNGYVAGCSSLFRQELLTRALPIPGNVRFHDWWISLVAAKSKGIKYLDEPLMSYRQHDLNVIGHIKGGALAAAKRVFFRSDENMSIYVEKREQLKLFSAFGGLNQHDRSSINDAYQYYSSYIDDQFLLRHWALTVIYFRRISVKKSWFRSMLNLIDSKGW